MATAKPRLLASDSSPAPPRPVRPSLGLPGLHPPFKHGVLPERCFPVISHAPHPRPAIPNTISDPPTRPSAHPLQWAPRTIPIIPSAHACPALIHPSSTCTASRRSTSSASHLGVSAPIADQRARASCITAPLLRGAQAHAHYGSLQERPRNHDHAPPVVIRRSDQCSSSVPVLVLVLVRVVEVSIRRAHDPDP
ncbi:hypothetical protein BD413DRAFT_37240 [Trametes elegans]|nr:hypothetical protein BD413DRAFT_37240 [Trametes elegans]